MTATERTVTTKKVATAGLLSALGVIISPYLWFPFLASKAYPAQHMINAIAGVLLGPWWASLIAVIVGTIRMSLGVGTVYAYPGGIPGAVVVGSVAWLLRRLNRRNVEIAALFEPLGTVLIGGTISVCVFAPILGHKEMMWALIPIWGSWAISSVPGCVMGYLALLGLRKIGITWRTFS